MPRQLEVTAERRARGVRQSWQLVVPWVHPVPGGNDRPEDILNLEIMADGRVNVWAKEVGGTALAVGLGIPVPVYREAEVVLSAADLVALRDDLGEVIDALGIERHVVPDAFATWRDYSPHGPADED